MRRYIAVIFIIWVTLSSAEDPDMKAPYEIEKFTHHPGIYFEKLGGLHQVESFWKVVIKIDVTTLSKRLAQVEKYVRKTDNLCKMIAVIGKETCENLHSVIEKGCERTNKLIERINSTYNTRIHKRGLIDGIGSVAKSLFGTMDANDEKLINEQLTVLHDSQELNKHAIKNQIKIMQATIAHIDNSERTIRQNENTLADATDKLRTKLLEDERQSNLHENFIIINAVLSDLTRDAEDVLEYLTFLKEGILHPRLTPISIIIESLKDASSQLPEGLYFPFRIKENEWSTIEKFATVGAYCDQINIYTILRFPLISMPKYEILSVIPLPIPSQNNIFSFVEINNPLIAIDTEQRTYITLAKNDLRKCIEINTEYLCTENHPVYRINPDSICEIKMYLETKDHYKNCNIKNATSNHSLWIALSNSHSWLYSSPRKQVITLHCKDHGKIKETIEKVGKITLKNNCKLVTENTIIRSPKMSHETRVESYLPQYNISLLQKPGLENDTGLKEIKLKNIIPNPTELKNSKDKLEEINNELDKNSSSIFQSPHFIFPMATSGTTIVIIIIAVVIGFIIIKKKKRNNNKRVTLDIDTEYTIPRSILKRSNSTRF
ncbi:uncharacterized protein LOC118646024 [Monomorium pharaonis]|uniref:uncharacterized protein LOC118646024 n=2 Tax=Monomorium pharaonis TaxID=307658 RepID=UPI0017474E98|nr:uncharacterized protein LOC118646024 [Monomorium pharaonis]